jgi:hypothetical protein
MKFRATCFYLAVALGLVSLNGCNQEAVKKAEQAAKSAASDAADAASSAAADAGAAVDAAAQQAATAAQNKLNDSMNEALNAVRGVEGGGEMVQSIRDIIGNIASTLSGIKDEASATAAAPELTKFTESLGSMNESFAKLPEPAKKVLSGLFDSALGDLKPQIEKILAIPGIDKVIKPVLDALLEKLGSFKAA